ncbi:MAG TPA: NAD(P)-dependent oxidoreductase [Paenalcaligenes hominis]|uniref:3-hydroxyisobutyrate dehydrogenase-like beta-hydroxyacid dehydrogenase n=1 Tax=Paenalcaligenes hominis TaxID=643674 RepID=A0A9D2VHB9_9BURK|nr:NAD(P)-dependent oxidoreductase [Paenalcaligenes hominis]NJB63901.1 3-hydroxyisobutyrate dehydrogenase-like beta-hydroxyacid dehydrogenase [Paenalcaligenes hominis]GGE61532.1 2-hydroxy-3-oxopropionate reductase [Paenalcaligenes hominis]HJH24983.1 NAD(P)-dependent oxidoreductase [Paenalcaligenes hominis]
MRIGFAGIGLMGLPMCRRLLQAGHQLAVWNRSQAKTAPLAAAGATVYDSPQALAAHTDVVILCLFDANAVAEVVFGKHGLVQAQKKTAITVVDHSSIAPQRTQALAKQLPAGWHWVDAPVSGGTAGAEAGTLAIMAGGAAEQVERIRPVLAAYAAQVTHMGAVGAGQVTKLCNQTIVTATITAIAEAMCLAQDANVEVAKLPEALAGGWADSVLLQEFVSRMLHLPEQPTATVQTMLKDLNTIAELAQTQGTAMPVSHAVQQLYQIVQRQGLGSQDVSHIIQTLKG